MPQYAAEPGQEDRHGEMTGAITINMILSMPPIAVWCIFIGPWLCSPRAVLWTAVALGVLLPLLCFFPSRWIWARVSAWMDRFEFD